MKKKHCYLSSIILVVLMVSNSIFAQNKEMDKLKDLIDRGNLEKAQAYCDKVTAPMAEKNSAKFFALMANAYYNKKDYLKAAEMVEKSEDFKLAAKLAKVFDDNKSEFADIDIAIKMYKKGKEPDKAAELLFSQGKFEEAALTSTSVGMNLKLGDSLFNQGKVNESLFFFKRAKAKGQKFSIEKVLDYCYKQRAYKLAYTIQDFNEGDFKMLVQGTVIDKMIEKDEPIAFIENFLDSLKIAENKQDEIIIEGYINNKLFDKAEAYCMGHQKSEQQICLSFLADKTKDSYPEESAAANIKLGRTYIAQDLLTNYLILTAKAYNDKWEKEPIDKKLLLEFYNKSKKPVERCEQKYCEFLLYASKMCKIKSDDLSKDKPNMAVEFARSTTFMQQVLTNSCK
jgi:tetratricopeptide (TPR) repeat protein